MVERARVSTCKRTRLRVVLRLCMANCGNGNETCAHVPGSTMTEIYKTEPCLQLYKSDETAHVRESETSQRITRILYTHNVIVSKAHSLICFGIMRLQEIHICNEVAKVKDEKSVFTVFVNRL